MTINPSLRESYRYCSTVARREAKNFYPSFLLLPSERRKSMCALYAFMRRTDDIADEPGEIHVKRRALENWREALRHALEGRHGAWPGWSALADTVTRHEIPTRHLHEVIDGVEMDLSPRVFESFEELRAYCYLVASAVGLCCIHIWGYQSESGKAEAMAESCGIALQLTNIIRDVGEDARNGRIYLPRNDMERHGVTSEDLAAPAASPALRKLLAFEASRAYEEYERAKPLIALIDPLGRPVLQTISGIYRTLLDSIVARDFEVLSQRVSIPKWRKAAIAARAFTSRFGLRRAPGLEARPSR